MGQRRCTLPLHETLYPFPSHRPALRACEYLPEAHMRSLPQWPTMDAQGSAICLSRLLHGQRRHDDV